MSGAAPDDAIAVRVRTLQIVVGALLAGVLIFAAVMAIVRAQQNDAPPDLPLLSLMAAGYAVVMFAVRAVVVNAMQAAARRKLVAVDTSDPRPWLNVFQTRSIVGAAFLEGAAFFLVIAYFMEGTPWTLAAAAIVWLALAWLHFPTRDRVESWIAEQQEALQHERMGM